MASHLLLGIFPGGMKAYVHTKTYIYTNVHCSFIRKSPNLKTTSIKPINS